MENCHVFSTRRKEIRRTELAKKVGRVIINQKLLNFINYFFINSDHFGSKNFFPLKKPPL